jgi:hypothetical protein
MRVSLLLLYHDYSEILSVVAHVADASHAAKLTLSTRITVTNVHSKVLVDRGCIFSRVCVGLLLSCSL